MHRASFSRMLLLAGTLVAASASAVAQMHAKVAGDYRVRANTVQAESLPPEVARRHGVDRGPRDALVNVVVLKGGDAGTTVRADIHVRAENRAGIAREVPMRPAVEAGRVSYIGNYRFAPEEVVDFVVSAKPEGTDQTIGLHFRQQFFAR